MSLEPSIVDEIDEDADAATDAAGLADIKAPAASVRMWSYGRARHVTIWNRFVAISTKRLL